LFLKPLIVPLSHHLMRPHRLVALLVLAVALGSTRAQDSLEFVRQVRSFPNPQTDNANCHRNSTDVFLCIGPNVQFDVQRAVELDQVAREIRRNGKSVCAGETGGNRVSEPGPTVGVAIVNQIQRPFSRSYTEQDLLGLAAKFSYNLLMRNWKAWLTRGSATCNDGIVVLYSRADQIVYISVGDQLRNILNTGLLSQVLVDSRTFFKSSEAIGLHYILDSLRDILSKTGPGYRTRENQVVGSALVASGQVGQSGAMPLASAAPLALLASLLPVLLAFFIAH